MPSFKVRPKKVSMHGRQQAIYPRTGETMFTMAKVSRIKTLSLRHNLEVCIGDKDDEVPPPPHCASVITCHRKQCTSTDHTSLTDRRILSM